MRAAGEVLEALDAASKGVDAASTELSRLITEFHEAKLDDAGEMVLGTALQFDIALKDELSFIYTDAIENERRPPAEDIRTAMASRAVQSKKPELWARYHNELARINALRSWLSNQKASISANQTVLKAERA